MASITRFLLHSATWLGLVSLLLYIGPIVPLYAQSGNLYLPLIQTGPAATVTVEGLITPEAGGQISFLNGKGRLTVAAGVVSQPLRVQVQTITPSPPVGYLDLGLSIAITLQTAQGQAVTHLAWPARLRIDGSHVDPALVTPETLRLFHQASNGQWTQLIHLQGGDPLVFDVAVSDFSPFGLFGQSTLRQMRGLVAAPNGDLYWTNDEDAAIYRRSATGATTIYHRLHLPVTFLSQKANNLAFDPASGALFFSDHLTVRRIDPDGSEVTLYRVATTGGIVGGPLGGMTLDPSNGALYITDGSVLRIDPQTGQKLGAILNIGGTRFDAVAADGTGHLYGLAFNVERSYGRFLPAVNEWSDLYVVNLDETPSTVRLVASGFVGARSLAVDDTGTVYVANELGDVLSVISGAPPAVTGRIETAAPWAIAFDASRQRLWVGAFSRTALTSLALTQRSPAAARGGAISGLDGSVSGQGSAVTVQLDQFDPLPAHHALWLGQTPLSLAAVDPVGPRLIFHLPDPFTTIPEFAQPLALAGTLRFTVAGGPTVTGGTPTFPEPGNYRNWQSGPQQLARDEWLIWHSTAAVDGYVQRVESLDNLFPPWDSTQGPWLAYHFDTPGIYTFRLRRPSGDSDEQTVTVTAESTTVRTTRWAVEPTVGAELRAGGVQISIPPGALPGTQPYTITLAIDQATVTTSDPVQYGNRYQLFWAPEPAQLNGQVTIRLPYAASQAGTPVGAIFDATLEGFTPIRYAVSASHVSIILPAMLYQFYPAAAPDPTGAAASRTALLAPTPPTGETPYHTLSTVTRNLWWVVGLANAQWESDHFIVRFNDGAIDTAYAYTLFQALEQAYQTFGDALHFTRPNGKIIARITPSIPADIDGFAPRVGTLSHWYLFFNDTLETNLLKATAAHELFHIFQQSNIATGASPWVDSWWLEGSAVWAEAMVFPEVKVYQQKIREGCTFAQKGFYTWGLWSGGLTEEERYGTAAFVYFLEDYHAGNVFAVFQAARPLTSLASVIEGVVGDMSKFYRAFAVGFWGQTFGPAAEWDLSLCKPSVYLTNAATTVLDVNALPPLSSGFVKAYYQRTGGDPPIGFTEADGSVLRVAKVGAGVLVHLLNGSQPPLQPAPGFSPLPAIDDNDGYALNTKLIDRTLYQPFNLVYLNSDTSAPSGQSRVVVEAPSLTACQVTPPLQAGQPWAVGLQGGGFGPLTGSASLGTISSWQENSVGLYLANPAYGTYTVRVTHKNSVTSNSCTFVVSN